MFRWRSIGAVVIFSCLSVSAACTSSAPRQEDVNANRDREAVAGALSSTGGDVESTGNVSQSPAAGIRESAALPPSPPVSGMDGDGAGVETQVSPAPDSGVLGSCSAARRECPCHRMCRV